MSKYRKEKIGNLVRDEVGQILLRELDLEEEALVTVTQATVSDDLLHAKVYISVLPSQFAEGVMEQIREQIYHFQQILNNKLRMRPIPKIFFVLDRTEEEAAKIERLIEENKK